MKAMLKFASIAACCALAIGVLALTSSPVQAVGCPPAKGNFTKIFCGGIAAIECPGNLVCIDDPRDDCCPQTGGADCGGVCARR